jgi:hypothetical protein
MRLLLLTMVIGLAGCYADHPIIDHPITDHIALPVTWSEDIYGHYYTYDEGYTLFPGDPPQEKTNNNR